MLKIIYSLHADRKFIFAGLPIMDVFSSMLLLLSSWISDFLSEGEEGNLRCSVNWIILKIHLIFFRPVPLLSPTTQQLATFCINKYRKHLEVMSRRLMFLRSHGESFCIIVGFFFLQFTSWEVGLVLAIYMYEYRYLNVSQFYVHALFYL